MKRLEGKVAIVTGAGQGLGEEIVKLFVREGACVVGTARRENKVQAVMDSIEGAADKTLAMHQDVSLREDWEKVVSAAVQKFGKVDILVNNAAQVTETDILHCTEDEMINVFKTNTLSIMLGIQTAAPEFEKLGGGVVVNVNSLAGIVSGDADGGSAPYSASKGAGRSLTKHAAYYLAPKNIRVNSIHPGPIMTPMLEKSLADNPAIAERVKQYNPLAPYISGPEDIANGVLFLASDESRCVTGAELVVDCGHLLM
ncbi:MAG: SDR family oxidoreductase [Oscillospiraceae bacterium]|nr:SDR family oxidoreductase [Oscillospiraceae bacterium]